MAALFASSVETAVWARIGGQGRGGDLGVPVVVVGVEVGVADGLPLVLVLRKEAVEVAVDDADGVADGAEVALEHGEGHLGLVDAA